MKVSEPRFNDDELGEVEECRQCPLDRRGKDTALCKAWWYRNGDTHDLTCPAAATYQEACELADTATKRAVKEYGR